MNEFDATRAGSDAFLRPSLHAMAGLQRYEGLSLEQLSVQARRLLLDTFGPAETSPVTRAAPGTVALLGEHTYYFDGFALLLPLPFGTAVAVRPVDPADAALVFDAPRRVVSLGQPERSGEQEAALESSPARIVAAGLAAYGAFQAAVVSTIPSGCADGALAALAVATIGAAQEATGRGDAADLLHRATAAVAEHIERPYGVAPILGACFGEEGRALAIDTATLEYVPLDLPARERLAWALVDGRRQDPPPNVYRRRRQAVAEASQCLHDRLPATEGALRALEHRQLDTALRVLPRRLRPPVRHLVTENRRVQQVIAAIRRADCQLLGGMMLISQASIETDWRDADDRIRRVVALGEERESLYGGRMAGREFGRCVLFVGQPAAAGRLVEGLRRDPPPELAGELETWLF